MKTTENTIKKAPVKKTPKPSTKKRPISEMRGILKGKIFMTEDCWDLGPC